ncbi:MAG: helix-turn-helix domain-containing protein, partial [Litorimonas sp.]
LGIYSSLIKIAAPDVWSDIDMAFEAPAHLFNCDLSRIVNAQCQFESVSNTIFFPSEILNRPLALRRAVQQSDLTDLSKRLIKKKRDTPMKIRVRNLIVLSLDKGPVYQETIAAELGVTSRTLRRHLTAAGVSFQELLDQCRMQLVTLEFKSKSNVSLSELAFKLGYSEHSTFSRAFSRWSGLTPQEYRQALAS